MLAILFPLRPPPSLSAGVLFLLSAILSFFLVAGLNFLVGLIAIRTKSILGILRAKYLVLELLSGLLIPTTLFPQPFRSILFASPFPHINYTPAAIYLGKATRHEAARLLLSRRAGRSSSSSSDSGSGAVRGTASRSRGDERRLHRERSPGTPASSACTSRSTRRRGWSTGGLFLGVSRRSSERGFVRLSADRVLARLSVRGWKFEEMVFLYGFSLIPFGIFNVFSWNLCMFADRYLIEGRFDRVLLRPVVVRVPGALRVLPARVARVDRHRRRRRRLGFAPAGPRRSARSTCCSSASGPSSARDLPRDLPRPDGHVVLDRGPDRHLPPVFNLMQFGRYPLTIYDAWVRLGALFRDPVRVRVVLSDRAIPAAPRVPARVLGGAARRRGDLAIALVCGRAA